MADKFMFSGTNGAAAVMGATVLSGAEQEHLFGQLLIPLLVQEKMTVGEAMVQAKQQLAESRVGGISDDVLASWTLLGDPTTMVVQP